MTNLPLSAGSMDQRLFNRHGQYLAVIQTERIALMQVAMDRAVAAIMSSESVTPATLDDVIAETVQEGLDELLTSFTERQHRNRRALTSLAEEIQDIEERFENRATDGANELLDALTALESK